MQILDLVVFKKVTPLQAFCYHADFLWLCSCDVANVELVSSRALILSTVVTDKVRSAHYVILDAFHQSWW